MVLFCSGAVSLASTLQRISSTACKHSPVTCACESLGGTSLCLVPNCTSGLHSATFSSRVSYVFEEHYTQMFLLVVFIFHSSILYTQIGKVIHALAELFVLIYMCQYELMNINSFIQSCTGTLRVSIFSYYNLIS